MKSFIDLLQEVHGYTISHGTRIPVSTGDGVFSFPLKLDYEPTFTWSFSQGMQDIKAFKSLLVMKYLFLIKITMFFDLILIL